MYRSFWNRLVKNKEGETVIWQVPNMPLIAWLVLKASSILIDHAEIDSGLTQLSAAFLFAWAYLEVVSGQSNFRRLIGAVVGAIIIAGYF